MVRIFYIVYICSLFLCFASYFYIGFTLLARKIVPIKPFLTLVILLVPSILPVYNVLFAVKSVFAMLEFMLEERKVVEMFINSGVFKRVGEDKI